MYIYIYIYIYIYMTVESNVIYCSITLQHIFLIAEMKMEKVEYIYLTRLSFPPYSILRMYGCFVFLSFCRFAPVVHYQQF